MYFHEMWTYERFMSILKDLTPTTESITMFPFTLASRPRMLGATHGRLETPVIARKDLAGRRWDGPLIVEEYDATTVVPPGWTAALDEWGSVVMTCG